MKVDFIILGAQKCGTTTLTSILKKHPALVCCNEKEPHFFSEADNWKKDLDKYHQLFSEKAGAKYFEASTTYTFYPYRNLEIWNDICEYNSKMKFIYLVRNPIDRIISSYMHSFEKGHIDSSIEEVVRKNRFFIDITRYYTQISPYIKKFGQDNVLILTFDELVESRTKVLNQVSQFLTIDFKPFEDVDNIHSNASLGGNKIHHKFDNPPLVLKAVKKFTPSIWDKITNNSKRKFDKKPRLENETKKMILQMLEVEILQLQKLMNRDLSSWMERDNLRL